MDVMYFPDNMGSIRILGNFDFGVFTEMGMLQGGTYIPQVMFDEMRIPVKVYAMHISGNDSVMVALCDVSDVCFLGNAGERGGGGPGHR